MLLFFCCCCNFRRLSLSSSIVVVAMLAVSFVVVSCRSHDVVLVPDGADLQRTEMAPAMRSSDVVVRAGGGVAMVEAERRWRRVAVVGIAVVTRNVRGWWLYVYAGFRCEVIVEKKEK